ncbi:fibrohexamerin-like, partial [Nymphalis io]|uniref:fibrohexamerin-like n=1 Tax=Inachis io TaxID=171585 RepID=UPI0021674D65
QTDILSGEDRNIERPCQVFDTYCIRKYFAENSQCKESQGPVPDPMYRAQSTTFLPRLNLTMTADDVLYSGLNGRIEEFYINRESDKLVLAIEFRNLTFYARDVYFRYHRRAREPIVNVDYVYINYRSVVSTVVIPNRKDLQLQKSEITSYLNEIPAFSIGRNAFESPDPQVQLAKVLIQTDVLTDVLETQLTESAYYASTFIQYSLCDFSLKVL